MTKGATDALSRDPIFLVAATVRPASDLMLAGAGWYAFTQLPIDAFPDVSSTQVKII